MMSSYKPLYHTGIFLVFMTSFAIFVGYGFPYFLISLLGMVGMSGMIAWKLTAPGAVMSELLGYKPSLKGNIGVALMGLGLLVGLVMGMAYRDFTGSAPLPHTLTYLAILAALIGMAEELVFRGFIFGQVRHLGLVFTIFLTAAAHTLYKVLLFLPDHPMAESDIFFLIRWTLIVGVIFGIMREASKDIYPALIAHAIFDVVVYGDHQITPWWVWM